MIQSKDFATNPVSNSNNGMEHRQKTIMTDKITQAKSFIAQTLAQSKSHLSSLSMPHKSHKRHEPLVTSSLTTSTSSSKEQQEEDDKKRAESKINPIAYRKRRHDHCSSIIKLLDDKSDVLFAHNTWDDFQCAGPRIVKHYTYSNVKGNKPWGIFSVTFSSSPGLLSSIDDYFVIKGRGHMAVMETS